MTYFLLRDYNILPKKELHWSPWVHRWKQAFGEPGRSALSRDAPGLPARGARLRASATGGPGDELRSKGLKGGCYSSKNNTNGQNYSNNNIRARMVIIVIKLLLMILVICIYMYALE